MVRKIFKILLQAIGFFVAFVILYIGFAYGLSAITVNSSFIPCDKDAIDVYILTNGVHTDIVVPISNQYVDWRNLVSPSDAKVLNAEAKNVAFGWGDKGFYLETPTWADLKFSTAFKACFYLSTSAMHVSFYNAMKESPTCRKICISKQNYLDLAKYIRSSFELDKNGNSQHILNASYSDNDAFYEANGKYSLFFTCNTWANGGLKSAGLRCCFWTPFQQAIFKKYE
jgi:uncharacterized protein (TIGR02117 family)